MSETTFAAVDNEVVTETTQAPNTTAAATSTELSAPTSGALTNPDSGLDPEDLNIDYLQVLGKSSQFEPDSGAIGDIIFNKTTPLSSLGEPLNAVVVGLTKFWKEDVPFGDDTRPRFAYTPEEAAAITASTEYKGVVPVSEITLLIERPASFEDDEAASGIFVYTFGGKEYALVKYTVQKAQAVRENYGTVQTSTRALATQDKVASDYYFELRTKEKGSGTKYSWYQFVLNGTSTKAPEDAVAFAKSLRGS